MSRGRAEGVGRAVLAAASALAVGCAEPPVVPGARWEERSPAALGFEESLLETFAQRVGGDGVVVREGYLAKAWGHPDDSGDWGSAAKPVLSTLLWFAVSEGRISGVEERVAPWVRRRFAGAELEPGQREMRFEHLAHMTSGYARGEEPGTHWAYNDFGTRLLAELLVEVFGSPLEQVLQERLGALRFEGRAVMGSRGGAGIVASPKDFARIGLWWLRRGRWKYRQLLPRRVFSAYLEPRVPADLPRSETAGSDYLNVGSFGGRSDQDYFGQGRYGFFWWFNRALPDGSLPLQHLPEEAFYALGHNGREVLLILPGWRVVAAARGDWGGQELDHARWLIRSLERGRARRLR
ncbi:MAG: serine hydrolase [Myxococcales bacterium]|nr:serine hydrolase [Myxococcales bacterium]